MLRLVLADHDGTVIDSWDTNEDDDIFAHLMDAPISEPARVAIDAVLSAQLGGTDAHR